MFISHGELWFRDKSVVCIIDQQIQDYYYSLIPKYYHAKPQRYDAHITIIRYWEIKPYMTPWYEEVEFEYEGLINFDGRYFYLNVHSKGFEQIRKQFGLPPFREARKCFHITLGNVK